VQLSVDGRTQQKTVVVRMDPRVTMSASALADQYAMAHDLAQLAGRAYAAMQQARAKKNDKAANTFARLNDRLAAFISAVDGVDLPVPQGTRAAYCMLRNEALSSLGAMPVHTGLCK
jgi:hypothetical protein